MVAGPAGRNLFLALLHGRAVALALAAARPRSRPAWFPAVASACGVAAPAIALAGILLALAAAPWFDWFDHNLSDLGVRPGTAPLFNGGLVLGGLLGLPFALRLHDRAHGEPWRTRGALALFAGFAFLALVGVFPQDVVPHHGIAAFGFFILTPVATMLFGYGELHHGSARYGAFGVAVGFAALVTFFSLLAVLVAQGHKYAIAEVVHAGLLAGWAGVSAVRLWARRG